MKSTPTTDATPYTKVLSVMIKGVLIAFMAQSLTHGVARSGNELLPLAGIAIFITAMLGFRELTASEPN
jgi:hypothetical protein